MCVCACPKVSVRQVQSLSISFSLRFTNLARLTRTWGTSCCTSFYMAAGTTLRSSCLCRTRSTDWAVSSALPYSFICMLIFMILHMTIIPEHDSSSFKGSLSYVRRSSFRNKLTFNVLMLFHSVNYADHDNLSLMADVPTSPSFPPDFSPHGSQRYF